MSKDNTYEGSKYSRVDRSYTIDGRTYRWSGWFGCQLVSVEKHMPAPQDRRRILGREFRPYSVERRGGWRRGWVVHWTLVGWSDHAGYARMINDLHTDLVEGRA